MQFYLQTWTSTFLDLNRVPKLNTLQTWWADFIWFLWFLLLHILFNARLSIKWDGSSQCYGRSLAVVFYWMRPESHLAQQCLHWQAVVLHGFRPGSSPARPRNWTRDLPMCQKYALPMGYSSSLNNVCQPHWLVSCVWVNINERQNETAKQCIRRRCICLKPLPVNADMTKLDVSKVSHLVEGSIADLNHLIFSKSPIVPHSAPNLVCKTASPDLH